MNKIIFIFCFLSLSAVSNSQQFLWSTVNDSTIKYVPSENVSSEVLKIYELYELYYDESGFSKDGFIKYFEGSKSFKYANSIKWETLKKKIKEIDKLTVFAFRDNLGEGSFVLVICITKENINLIRFSNNYESNALLCLKSQKDKFIKWFNTLLE